MASTTTLPAVVVDSQEDPAWGRVEEFLARRRPANVDVVLRRTLHATAGLKCSSLLDAVEGLDESIDVVAQLDGDVIPPGLEVPVGG